LVQKHPGMVRTMLGYFYIRCIRAELCVTKGMEESGMNFGIDLIITSIMLGMGLAMDAFSVSLANGLHEPLMRKRRMCFVAGVFALFQGFMPLIGWICVHTIMQYFVWFENLIPWIALILLAWIGGKMLVEGIHGDDCTGEHIGVGLAALMVQGVATSIDALSVGFTIAEYDFPAALASVLIIAVVTFVICLAGLIIGRKAGTKIAGKAGILGGSILILIGLEIFLTGVL